MQRSRRLLVTSLTEVYRARIREAIEDYRRDRRPDVLRWRTLFALGATVLLLLRAYAGRRIISVLRSGAEGRYNARIEGLQDRSLHIVKVEQIWRVFTGLLNSRGAWVSP
jgi:hypothetical protein